MKKMVICGSGGMATEILSLIRILNERENRWNIVGFTDDGSQRDKMVHGLPILGDDKYLVNIKEPCDVVLAVGDPQTRSRIISSLRENEFLSFPTLIHPLAYVDREAVMGKGVVLFPFCAVQPSAVLGDFVFLNCFSLLGHNVSVGSFSMVMSKVNILGSVTIGEKVLIGAGSVLLQGLSVADNVIIGIGSVVLTDVPAAVTVLGNPAKIIRRADVDSSNI